MDPQAAGAGSPPPPDYIAQCEKRRVTPVYFYIQVFWVSNIKLNEQTFDAFFYFRATWVKKRDTTKEEAKAQNGAGSNKTGQNQTDATSIEKPPIMILNAIGEPNIKDESTGESPYRTYGDGKAYRVLEWRGRIHGTFRYIFQPDDFPFDKQRLFVLWSSTKPGWALVEDVYGMGEKPCRSEVRAELHEEPGFELAGPQHKGSGTLKRLSVGFETKEWPANTGNEMSMLKFWILVSRTDRWYYFLNVLGPCILVNSAEFLIFAIPRSNAQSRISNTLSLVFLLLPSKFLISSVFPRVGNPTVCEYTALAAFGFLVISLIIVVIGAVIGNSSSRPVKIQYERYSACTMVILFVVNVSCIAVSWYRCFQRNGNSVYDIHETSTIRSKNKATLTHDNPQINLDRGGAAWDRSEFPAFKPKPRKT